MLPDEIYVKITATNDNLLHNHITSNLNMVNLSPLSRADYICYRLITEGQERYTVEITEYLYTSEIKHQLQH